MIHTILVHSCSSLLLASCTSMDTYLLKILPRINMSDHFPTQLMYHRDPSYTHICVFGCLCYPFFPSTTIKKLQLCLTLCVFLGYTLNHIGYKCFNLSHKNIIILHRVIFDETRFPFACLSSPPLSD